MIDRLIAWSLGNRFLVLALTGALALVALYAAARTPIDLIPDLSENQVVVAADWPGHGPEEIDLDVTRPLSLGLRSSQGVRAVRAHTGFGFAMVDVLFEDRVPRTEARARVTERLASLETDLPAGVAVAVAPDATALAQIFWYTLQPDPDAATDLGELRTLEDTVVAPALATVPGVAEVASVGGASREWQVDVDPARLLLLGVTLADVEASLRRASAGAAGGTVETEGAAHLVRGEGFLSTREDLLRTVVRTRDGLPIRVADVASVTLGPGARRSVLERDGSEAVGGVVLLRTGENPLQVTAALHRRIRDLATSLPAGIRIVPFYERTRLIEGAIRTLTRTLLEEALLAFLVILLVMRHLGASLVVAMTIPLAVLAALAAMRVAAVPANVMSLAGIAVSIGVLVDQAIVLTDNAMHRLRERFGDEPVRGDIASLLVRPCQEVGRPILFAVLVMLLSFLPVFALEGIEGRMFQPLAWTKTFVLAAAGLLSLTFLPAILPTVLRGRIGKEEDSFLVRSVAAVYRPVLSFFLDRPRTVVLGFTAILGLGWIVVGGLGREFLPPLDEGSILDMPVTSPRVSMTQAANDLRARNELLRTIPEARSVAGKAGRAETATDPSPLEMVETVIELRPRAAWPRRHLADEDARAGAAEIVDLLVRRGALHAPVDTDRAGLLADVALKASAALDEELRALATARQGQHRAALGPALVRRAVGRAAGFLEDEGRLARLPTGDDLDHVAAGLAPRYAAQLAAEPLPADVKSLVDDAARALAARGFASHAANLLVGEEGVFLRRLAAAFRPGDRPAPDLFERIREDLVSAKDEAEAAFAEESRFELEARVGVVFSRAAAKAAIRGQRPAGQTPAVAMPAEVESGAALRGWRPFLRTKTKAELVEELDRSIRVPGWANIWTQPIVNRIDMLSTGIRTAVGVKVLGVDPDQIARVAAEVAVTLREVAGAADVVADSGLTKGIVEIEVDRERAAALGVEAADAMDAVDAALGGRTVGEIADGATRTPVRLLYQRSARADLPAIGRVLVPAEALATSDLGSVSSPAAARPAAAPRDTASAHGGGHGATRRTPAPVADPGGSAASEAAAHGPRHVELRDVATITLVDRPAMIRSENGVPAAYVQANVRGRDAVGFVDEARRAVEASVSVPAGVRVEWAGEWEHHERAAGTLLLVVPASVLLILLLLYLTYRDLLHAALVLLAVPGALAGGILFQAVLGENLSVAAWVGFVACFGMATETGIVMLVYLRGAIERAGGLASIGSVEELRTVVLDGAVRRLRPKLLTEATLLLGLAPMLWASDIGSEVTRPMVVPLLGGILLADEVIDILLPALFFRIERWRWLRRRRGVVPTPG